MPSRIRVSGLLFAAIAAAALAAGAASVAAQERPINVGVVNLDYVVANSPAGKALQEKLAKFQEEAQGEIDAKTAATAAIRQRGVDGANSLTEEKLAELQQELEDAQIAVRRLRETKQREGQKMQEEGLKEIEKQLEPVFTAVRDEGGYDLILNNVPGVVLMVGEGVDITQKVVDKLKAGGGG